MKIKIAVSCSALLICLLAADGSALGSTSYFGYDQWGGTWHDAEKNPSNTEDDLMCWAAAASNVLAWTGWGYPIGQGFSGTDDMFGYFQNHWTDKGGMMQYGWDWWFDGTYSGPTGPNWSQVDVPGGDFWDPAYNFNNYYFEENRTALALSAIDEYLHAGYGVTLAIYNELNAGHALTVWGYDFDDVGGDYLGIWVTDSDDDKGSSNPPDVLAYYDVSLSDGQWNLGGSYGDWHIEKVQAFEKSPVPIAGAAWLLGSGLIALAGIRRKMEN